MTGEEAGLHVGWECMNKADAIPHPPLTRDRDRSSGLTERQATLASAGILLLISLFSAWRILGSGTLIGQDSATQFYPWYSYLGERLRDFELPAWNPSQFSGAPFAADPQSGWTYLPAMASFALLPLSAAVSFYLAFHLLLAGFGAFALARVLGMGPIAALTSGVAYELSGPVFSRSVCCPAQLQVISWVPVVLIGIEMTMRRETWESRLRWMALAAFGMSQVVASWIGQGSYYVALVAGAYVLYRGLIDPVTKERNWRSRGVVTLACGFGVAGMTAAFSAAGILPRLEFNRLSNVAGGVYESGNGPAAISGGWQAGSTFFREVTTDPYYMGSVVIALVSVSLILARGRLATPFFSFVVLTSFVLTASVQTPLHKLFYLVFPRFEELHRHWPERVTMAGFIALAMLAGAAVESLPSWAGSRRRMLGVAAVPLVITVVFTVALQRAGDGLPTAVYVGVAIAIGALIVVAFGRTSQHVRLATIGLVALLSAELLTANAGMLRNGPYGGYFDVDLEQYFQPSNAGQFLIGQNRDELNRFFGFDPRIQQMSAGWPVYYRYQFGNERTRSLVVNNRATLHGLQDVQGYNPVQLQASVDYMVLLNGTAQDYHDANVTPDGLDSPLLDILNARHIVAPSAATTEGDQLLTELGRTYESVFDDGFMQVLTRPNALPRAWIVHDAVSAEGLEAAQLVVDGVIDPAVTASIDGMLPALQPVGSKPESAVIQRYEPERIVLRTESAAPGLLLLSEVAYPSWEATVDGVPVGIQTAFGLIRAIPLPAGTHTVEFRYNTDTEQLGLYLSIASVALVGGLMLIPSARRRWTTGRSLTSPKRA